MRQPFKHKILCPRISHPDKFLFWIVSLLLGWLILWFAPWQIWFDKNLWVRVGISLVVFIAPGANLYLLLNLRPVTKLGYFSIGFVLSHLLLAMIGTAGRLFHFPFTDVKNIYMTLGFILIGASLFIKTSNASPPKPLKETALQFISYLPLALITALAAIMTVQRVITSDDLAYLAHITNWQHMPSLNFVDVYFDTAMLESTRFWVVSSPFGQAFLSEISGVPSLILLSGYLEPYLATISILSIYELARIMRLTHRSAMAAVAFQILFLALLSDYLHPGAPFFRQLSTDKATAAFILAPVFLYSAIQFLDDAKKGTALILILIGFSLSFMHPVITAFTILIVSMISMFGINRDNYKKHLVLIVITVVILSPQIGIRLINHEAQPIIPYNIDDIEQSRGIDSLITRLGATKFFGFNPTILEMHIPYDDRLPINSPFLPWIWLIIPVSSALASIRGLNDNYLKQYILAASLLVGLAGIPFTGWILGYFVSAWMLERTTWLFPFGISTIVLILIFRDSTKLGMHLNSWKITLNEKFHIEFTLLAKALIWAVPIVFLLLFFREQGLPNFPRLQSSTQRYRELSLVGQHIDKSAPDPVNVVGTDDLNDFIPTLSWKAKVISYRPEDPSYPYFYTEKERMERWSDRQALFSAQTPPDGQMEIIKKYNVKYILMESYKFAKIKDLISAYPLTFDKHSFGRYLLIEVIKSE